MDEAYRVLEDLLSVQPDNAEARFLFAVVATSRGDFHRALAIAENIVRAERSSRGHYARALAHHGLGHKAEALADIEAAIRIGPDHPNLRQWQAKIRAMP
jgi:tetratricopeptide (TPR) repeat protein